MRAVDPQRAVDDTATSGPELVGQPAGSAGDSSGAVARVPVSGANGAGATLPQLAPGVEQLGECQGSGLTEATYLVRNTRGRIMHQSRLLYLVLSEVDGNRTASEIAGRVSVAFGRTVSAGNVEYLLTNKLTPAGLLATDERTRPSQAADQTPDILALKGRRTLVTARAVQRIAGLLQPLFKPFVVVTLLACWVAVDVWLFGFGSAQLGSALRYVLTHPLQLLLVFGLTVLSGLFHESGHAAACRYGGARPGAIGMGIYVIWPAFCTNVTDAYRLGRAGRIRTDLGGVYFNAIYTLPLAVPYLATGYQPLLAAIVLVHLEIVQQLLPSLRFDGYFILADLIGVPDLFRRIMPTLRSMIPGRPADPRVRTLKRSARVTLTAWVLLIVPLLAFQLTFILLNAPSLAKTSIDSVQAQVHSVVVQFGRVNVAGGLVGVISLLLAALPPLGLCFILLLTGRRTLRLAVVASRRRPVLRYTFVAAGFLVAAGLAVHWGILPLGGDGATSPRQSGAATASRPQPLPTRLQPAGAALAQSADEGGARIVRVDSTRPPDVAVTVSVPENASTIPAAAFRLWEDGQPQPVRVTQVPNDALRVCLVVDSSAPASSLDLARLQSAAAELLIRLPMGAQAAVVSTGNAPHVIQPFTDDRAQLISALSGLPPGGGPVDGALSLATTQLSGAKEGRLAVVLITSTPGPSRAAQEIVQRFGETNTVWYLVQPASEDHSSGNPIPAELVTANGTAISRSNETGLINALDAVSADLLSQYQVTYQGTHTGARHLRVAVSVGALQVETSATVVVHPPGYTVPGAASKRSRPTSSGRNLLGWIVLAALAIIALSGLVFFRTRLAAAASNVAAVWVRSRPGDHIREYSKWVGRRGTPKRAKWTAADSTAGPAGPNPPLAEPTSLSPASSPTAAFPAVGVASTATASGDIPPASDPGDTQAPQPRPKRAPSTGATLGAEHLDAATTDVLAELSETATAAATAAATLATTAAPAAAAAAAAALAAAAGSNNVEFRGSGDAGIDDETSDPDGLPAVGDHHRGAPSG